MKLALLFEPEFAVFTTREFATRAGISVPNSSRQLSRLPELVRVTRGVWANPKHEAFHPHLCVEKLLGHEQGYVSFLTALSLHGVISQIPPRIHVATTGHARRVPTHVGTFELFHITPRLMQDGVTWSETRVPYRLATAEKALFDTLYISTRKGRRFRSLPELDLSRVRFSRRRFETLFRALDDPRIAAAVRSRFEALGERE